MKTYNISNKLTDLRFSNLLQFSKSMNGSFLMVKRNTLGPKGTSLIQKLAPFLIKRERTSHWPGTVLLTGQQCEVIQYRLTNEAIEILKNEFKDIFELIGPEYPEDLCFLRSTGEAWFVSISHERDYYVILTEEEKDNFESLVGKGCLELQVS